MKEPEALGEIIARKTILRSPGRRLELEMINRQWVFLAGERLAEVSRATKLEKKVLTVSVQGGAWASEMSLQSAVLLSRIQGLLGEKAVRKVKVRSSPPPDEIIKEIAFRSKPEESDNSSHNEDATGNPVREAFLRMMRSSNIYVSVFN